MDLGNIVYIVAVIGYFIYQATKNKKKNLPGGEEQQLPSEPAEKHTSFEDLLREIREAQKPKQVAQAKPVQVKPPVIQVDRPELRPDPVVQKRFPTTRRMEILNDEEIEHYEGAFMNNRHDAIKPSEGIPDIPSLKETVQRTTTKNSSRYNKMLHNPQSIKDAIVLKEILDRKHF